MRAVLALPFLIACETPAPPASTVDVDELIAGIDGLTSAEGTCLRQQCATVTDAAGFATCRTESCARRDDAWTLVPATIRHEGNTAFVQARLGYTAGGYGPVDAPRQDEAFVGCTLVTSTGEEIDLAVTTVFPTDLERPFTLSSEVGPDVRDVIFGVWDRKVEPCDSERMGCKVYGFLLDGSLATWPPTVYEDGTRQRIPPAEVSLVVLDGGVGSGFAERRQTVVDAVNQQLAVFGSKVGAVQWGLAPEADTLVVVSHADPHDALIGRQLAGALGGSEDRVFAAPDAEASFAVTIGGTAPMHARLLEAGCADKRNAAYDACVSEL